VRIARRLHVSGPLRLASTIFERAGAVVVRDFAELPGKPVREQALTCGASRTFRSGSGRLYSSGRAVQWRYHSLVGARDPHRLGAHLGSGVCLLRPPHRAQRPQMARGVWPWPSGLSARVLCARESVDLLARESFVPLHPSRSSRKAAALLRSGFDRLGPVLGRKWRAVG